jgi:hypothetical protein
VAGVKISKLYIMENIKIELQIVAEVAALKKIILTTPELKDKFEKERDTFLKELENKVNKIMNSSNDQ